MRMKARELDASSTSSRFVCAVQVRPRDGATDEGRQGHRKQCRELGKSFVIADVVAKTWCHDSTFCCPFADVCSKRGCVHVPMPTSRLNSCGMIRAIYGSRNVYDAVTVQLVFQSAVHGAGIYLAHTRLHGKPCMACGLSSYAEVRTPCAYRCNDTTTVAHQP